MNVYLPILVLTFAAPASLESWSIVPSMNSIFSDQSSFTNFIEEQSDRMKKFVSSSYDMTNYYETIKQSGRKIADTWSYVPYEDSDSLLENPDVTLSVPAIIRRNGYNCETHTVISGGYVLNIHRILHPKNKRRVPMKTVLLQHGLFASSADWILNGPEKGLGYVLADAGHDVWMTNVRGNRYSKEHLWLKPDSKAYWDFTWHDVALSDIPAIIDYILETKGRNTKITYIGHSMGTTILFAMLSLRPEYNQKLSAGFALAPVVFLSDLKSPLKSLAPMASNLASIDMLQGSYEFIPKSSILSRMASSCVAESLDNLLCKNIAFYICGFNEKQFNRTLLPVFLAHLGTGTSWKTTVHFSQEILNGGNFQQFDYGYYHNMKIYGSFSPPEYDLSKVTLPIKLFWANNDLLSSERDVSMLYNKLPRKPDTYLVSDPEFNHLDYLWAIDAPKLLNNEVLRSLNNYMSK